MEYFFSFQTQALAYGTPYSQENCYTDALTRSLSRGTSLGSSLGHPLRESRGPARMDHRSTEKRLPQYPSHEQASFLDAAQRVADHHRAFLYPANRETRGASA